MAGQAMCTKCGSTEVFWHKNRNGKWVLCVKAEAQYEFGKGAWIQPHACEGKGFSVEEMVESYSEIVAAIFSEESLIAKESGYYQQEGEYLSQAAAEANSKMKALRKALGENVPSIPVEVFKGRKVPVGTVGEVVWVGESFGALKVGIKPAEGEVQFTAASNVKIIG